MENLKDNDDDENLKHPIENLRRKSCECKKCGGLTSFQKKTDLISATFQTKYTQKKLDMQRHESEMEKNKMTKLTMISSLN